MVGLSLSLLIVTCALAWAVARPANDVPYKAAVPTSPVAPSIDAGRAAEALQQLVSTVSSGDRDGAAALAGPDATAAGRLSALVDAATAARIEDFTLRYIDDVGGVAADGSWAATVDVSWTYSSFDAQPNTTQVSFRFAESEGRVAIAGIGVGGGASRTPVWMSGPMQVRRSDDLLVVAASGIDIGAYVRLARSALPRVSNVLTQWRPRLVVEVPADGAGLEAALGVEAGYYAQIAAVAGSAGDLRVGTPIHVFVNPDVFASLGRAGRAVVLAHEATHVATNAPFSEAPTWLIEGFADFVALRRTTLPFVRTAGQIAAQVQDDGLPDALPGPADFDTRGPHLGAAYEASWLVCTTLAERAGADAVLDFYKTVSRGGAIGPALRDQFRWSRSDLVQAWRQTLSRLPGVERALTPSAPS